MSKKRDAVWDAHYPTQIRIIIQGNDQISLVQPQRCTSKMIPHSGYFLSEGGREIVYFMGHCTWSVTCDIGGNLIYICKWSLSRVLILVWLNSITCCVNATWKIISCISLEYPSSKWIAGSGPWKIIKWQYPHGHNGQRSLCNLTPGLAGAASFWFKGSCHPALVKQNIMTPVAILCLKW